MDADRWTRIESLYHEAIDVPADARPAWLARRCGTDDGLRAEVAALLRYDREEESLLDRSALTAAARAVATGGTGNLVGRRIGDYEVLAPIGAGGMGDVYRALDVRLRREVALKVFEHAASLAAVHRFEAEARAASTLTHPNIVTVYGAGEQGDLAYIAMELVRGRTLRAALAEGRLTVAGALDVAAQLAEAVAAAHAAGIVHRDLKPENVMLTPEGRVKVLDFGIAMLQHDLAAEVESAGAAFAPTPAGVAGAGAGTPGYMAPEQAAGHAVTAAVDRFAFGVICREMLSGTSPASGATSLDEVIARCLAPDPADRFRDSAELLSAVRLAQAGAAPLANPGGLTRRRAIVLGVTAVAGAALAGVAWRGTRAAARRSIAVLPFENASDTDGTQYLCDGVTEVLIRQLATVPSLTVIARATAFAFRGSAADPRSIGTRLGVDATLHGTVARRAGRVLISAELIESATGARLWGDDLDRPVDDVLAVQDEIAAAILVQGLGRTLSSEERRRLGVSPIGDPEAFELFLRAVHHLRLTTEEDYLTARELLARSVDRAPRFALALVTLASTHSVMAVDGYEAPATTWPAADALVARALTADPDLADAHAEAAASAFFYRWDWRETERRWTRALRLRNEVQSELLSAYALQKWATGDPRSALELARAARAVDPLSAQAGVREGDLLAALGRLDDAAATYARVIAEVPGDPRARFGLAEVRRAQGRFDEALGVRRLAHLAAGDTSLEPVFARARGASGYEDVVRATAQGELDHLRDRRDAGRYVSSLDLARALVQVGEVDAAMDDVRAAIDERAAGLALLGVDPVWTGVRGDARFAAALARVGLPARAA